MPLHDIPVAVNDWQRDDEPKIHLLKSGKTVTAKTRQGHLEFVIPRVDIFEVARVDVPWLRPGKKKVCISTRLSSEWIR